MGGEFLKLKDKNRAQDPPGSARDVLAVSDSTVSSKSRYIKGESDEDSRGLLPYPSTTYRQNAQHRVETHGTSNAFKPTHNLISSMVLPQVLHF